MCDDVLNYQTLYECQVNKYVAPDGTRPFAKAPDSQVSAVTVKYINWNIGSSLGCCAAFCSSYNNWKL